MFFQKTIFTSSFAYKNSGFWLNFTKFEEKFTHIKEYCVKTVN